MQSGVPHIIIVAGTRPEFIKISPVLRALKARSETATWSTSLFATGQHQELAVQAWDDLGLVPDKILTLDKLPKRRVEAVSYMVNAIAALVQDITGPRAILVQGDTNSALAGAMAGEYSQVPIIHLEAGLRTGNELDPYPEELNRRLIAGLAQLHLAPTPAAVTNLKAAGIEQERIVCIGNTSIDAALAYAPTVTSSPLVHGRYMLATCHRRESWGAGLSALCAALRCKAEAEPGLTIVFVLHANPAVAEQVCAELGSVENVCLLPPQSYPGFLNLLVNAAAVVTDSGGIQEEASLFGIPIVVCRKTTERQELLSQAAAWLCPMETEGLLKTLEKALKTRPLGRRASPFGDGQASNRAVTALVRFMAGQNPVLLEHEEFIPLTFLE